MLSLEEFNSMLGAYPAGVIFLIVGIQIARYHVIAGYLLLYYVIMAHSPLLSINS